MKNLATISIKNRNDALKYAFAFMKTDTLNLKECSFLDIKQDMFITYSEDVPEWDLFKKVPPHISSPGFTCVASLDTKDQKRVNLTWFGDSLIYNCYGNYENEAKKAFDNITSRHLTLK